MRTTIRSALFRLLSTERIARLRSARASAQAMIKAGFGRGAFPIVSGGQTRADVFVTETLAAEAYRHGDAAARTEIKCALVGYAVADPRYAAGFDQPLLRQRFADNAMAECMLGAGAYAAGDMPAAAACFDRAIELEPGAFHYLCRSRCESPGRADDEAALRILQVAMAAHPSDYQLRLSLAGAHYRLGMTKAANEELQGGGEGMRRWLAEADPNIESLAAEVSRAVRDGLSVRSDRQVPGYSETAVQTYWEMLWYHMATATGFQHGWANLSEVCQRIISDVLVKSTPTPRSVVNFGVFCGYPDHQLALRFPAVSFLGVDLQERTKALNEAVHVADNLRFAAGDIVDVLSGCDFHNDAALLFHARTATILFPERIKQVYRAAFERGVEYIAMWENNSLSLSEQRFYDFGEVPLGCIPYSSVMLIHDYERILEAAGYRVESVQRQPSTRQLIEYPQSLADCHVALVARRR